MEIKKRITWIDNNNPLLRELEGLDSQILEYFIGKNSGAKLLAELPKKYSPTKVIISGDEQRVWEIAGLLQYNKGRIHEAKVCRYYG